MNDVSAFDDYLIESCCQNIGFVTVNIYQILSQLIFPGDITKEFLIINLRYNFILSPLLGYLWKLIKNNK